MVVPSRKGRRDYISFITEWDDDGNGYETIVEVRRGHRVEFFQRFVSRKGALLSLLERLLYDEGFTYEDVQDALNQFSGLRSDD